MDFSLDDTQQSVRDVAGRIFAGHATPERIKEVERGEERVDRQLWNELAKANILGLAIPEEDGGSGLGMVELCLVLEQQGIRVAPVPLLATVVLGAMPLARFGSPEQRSAWIPGVIAGDVILSGAITGPTGADEAVPPVTATPTGAGWALNGRVFSVPAGHLASRVIVPAVSDDGILVLLVDPDGAGIQREIVTTTNRERAAHITFVDAPVDESQRLGTEADGAEIVEWMTARALTGLAAVQAGVTAEAVRMTAEYTSGRHQFGRPLSTFQGVALKAADAFIDTQAIHVTLWQAAWRLDAGLDATTQVLVAKWWAAEAGQRVVHATQHLHGGLGADVDYPIHRYFLWGRQIEGALGAASPHLARLGRVIAERAKAG